MLSKLRVQRYKSLFDVEVDLEPLTVFIGPNGSGKSNVCEALAVLSGFLQQVMQEANSRVFDDFTQSLNKVGINQQTIESKFWHGVANSLLFHVEVAAVHGNFSETESLAWLTTELFYEQKTVSIKGLLNEREREYTTHLRNSLVESHYTNSPISQALGNVCIYDFNPTSLSRQINSTSPISMNKTGEGISDALVDVLHDNRQSFDELEDRLARLVPNIKRIALPRTKNDGYSLQLIDRYSEHHIPASDISDGTLRILAFLTALYQKDTPSIICFEEPENGVHPWLLSKMMELLKLVATEGITGKPVQVLITTHSPVLLNYVEPQQVRAVELDNEGKTQIHPLPVDSARFQKAMEAYDGALGELWFTNIFGGNPA